MKKRPTKKLKKCRWCEEKYDPKTSEHKNLCSDKCFHEEQSIQ